MAILHTCECTLVSSNKKPANLAGFLYFPRATNCMQFIYYIEKSTKSWPCCHYFFRLTVCYIIDERSFTRLWQMLGKRLKCAIFCILFSLPAVRKLLHFVLAPVGLLRGQEDQLPHVCMSVCTSPRPCAVARGQGGGHPVSPLTPCRLAGGFFMPPGQTAPGVPAEFSGR